MTLTAGAPKCSALTSCQLTTAMRMTWLEVLRLPGHGPLAVCDVAAQFDCQAKLCKGQLFLYMAQAFSLAEFGVLRPQAKKLGSRSQSSLSWQRDPFTPVKLWSILLVLNVIHGIVTWLLWANRQAARGPALLHMLRPDAHSPIPAARAQLFRSWCGRNDQTAFSFIHYVDVS